MDQYLDTAGSGQIIKRLSLCFCAVFIILCCLPPAAAGPIKYTESFYDAFDTVITLIGYTEDPSVFDGAFESVRSLYLRYHRVFDNYHEYEGVYNLYYLNAHAAEGYTPVEPELMELLVWMKEKQDIAMGRVNIAMGSVLSVWHRYREEGVRLPPTDILEEAAKHTGFENVILDLENGTVFFSDPLLQLDLGAVGKGYATEIAARYLDSSEMPSYIINAGGNVRCGASPLDGRQRWGVGVSNPSDPNVYMDIIYTKDMSVVTSGDYQRFYTVDGKNYHHIIDPDTLFPSAFMHGVTVVCPDSGLADLLSTAFFNMPYADGRRLAESLEGVEVYWVLTDGTVEMTDGMAAMLSSQGASGRD